jgi:copper(I)-binding protein
MLNRVVSPVRVRFTAVVGIIISVVVAFSLVGCAGNRANQDISAVDGAFANARGTIALRDVLIPNPNTAQGAYLAGATVPVLLAIVNQGGEADQLVAVTSPAASQVQITGTTDIPPGATVISTADSAVVNPPPTSPLVAGRLHILLTLNRALRDGLNIALSLNPQNRWWIGS